MATIRRATNGATMNTCASCGATMSVGETFCPQCGRTALRPAKPPSAWRVITSLLALGLLGGGAFVLTASIVAAQGCDEGLLCIVYFLPMALGVALILAGALFALATFLPFQRVLAGAGVALLGAIALWIASPTGLPVWLVGAGAFLYLGYRVARPFGTFQPILVGAGAALVGAIGLWIASQPGWPFGVLDWVLALGAFFYLGYRLPR